MHWPYNQHTVFRGIMGCSRGVPGLFRAVPGCSGEVPGCSGAVPGMFRGVPGLFRVLQTPPKDCTQLTFPGSCAFSRDSVVTNDQ